MIVVNTVLNIGVLGEDFIPNTPVDLTGTKVVSMLLEADDAFALATLLLNRPEVSDQWQVSFAKLAHELIDAGNRCL